MAPFDFGVLLLISCLIFALGRFARVISREFRSTLRNLPGPANPSRLLGNLKESLVEDGKELHDQWTTKYGKTMRYNGLLNSSWLYTSDMKALRHVLQNVEIYTKPSYIQYQLGQLAGPGILIAEGHDHKKQRRAMNPAFGMPQIREVTPVFIRKSMQLRDNLEAASAKRSGPIDVLPWISRATLDIIGLAGFNYDFNMSSGSDKHTNHELNKGLAQLFHSKTTPKILPFLAGLFPIFRILPAENGAVLRRVQQILYSIGRQLLLTAKTTGTSTSDSMGCDILSLLIQSNMATAESQRLSDKDVIAQIPTLLVAGDQTSSAAISWAMYILSSHPDVQRKLRAELYTIDTDEPTLDQLASLVYLDQVVREVIRIHSAVPIAPREATKDDLIPLDSPVTDSRGVLHSHLRISKGQIVLIPIAGINTDKTIWGEDSYSFRPERWDNVPKAANSIPGSMPNLMTFFGGPRGCIGMKFALVEMKAVLFTLVRAFEFELAAPADDIIGRTYIVRYPMIKSDREAGAQLPLHIRACMQNSGVY